VLMGAACIVAPLVIGKAALPIIGVLLVISGVLELLETFWVADEAGQVRAGPGQTGIFIHPPYRFRVADALLTNFHLPRSTLLMLVCAFAGRELTLRAYEEAIRERYRFYSYGDCMLIE
ncbi:MAG: S-adenosylmethionine:tRNA ribosyltransferase-isomerase, partial [Verrucomicrobiae bacterium]|nr:S-adenosylmethionine:tRNA ribosyltransferase-isomerase [Verrucomicrobiae bacterium]